MKKNLIIGAVGDQSLHRHWVNDKSEYDLFLIYYGDNKGYLGEGTYYKRAKGYKYHLIKDVIDENPWVLDYDYIWLPDDDVYADPWTVNRLFELISEYNLQLAQPSIMGWYGVQFTLHRPGSIIRFTNWVEIMCPCFSSDALSICKDVFKENECGWSIETIWNVLLGHPTDKIGILDEIVAIHARPVLTGDTYKDKEHPLAFAMRQARSVYSKWNLSKEMDKDRKVGKSVDSDIYGAVVYKQINKTMERGIPKDKRFWPPCNFFSEAIEKLKGINEPINIHKLHQKNPNLIPIL